MHISFAMLPLLPPASAGTATSEADQNRSVPVPGRPERFGADGHGRSADCVSVFELVFLSGLFANDDPNPGPEWACRLSKSRDCPVRAIPSRHSGRTRLVTTSADSIGGVVTQLCAFIPNPVRPGDPPGRLASNLYFQTSSTPASAALREPLPAIFSSRTGSCGRSSPYPAPKT
jgi:hypothetical protein